MAFTYSGDPSSSDTDLVRFLVHDTIEADYVVQDAEITYLLTTWTNPYLAASHCAEIISAHYSKQATSKTVGDLSISYAGKASDYHLLAQHLFDMYLRLNPPTPWADSDSTVSTANKSTEEPKTDFYTGMSDNRRVRPIWYER